MKLNKTYRKCLTIIFPLIVLVHNLSLAQNNMQLGNWTMYFGQIRITDKWGIHAEAQYRDFGLADEAEQILLRGGINYHLNPSANLTAGFARINNYLNDDVISQKAVTTENRFWQQFFMRNHLGRIVFENRFRLEQRIINSNNTTKFLNRVRYLLRTTIPLNKQTIEKNTLFISLYDELFIHISNTPFDRNRFYAAIGYQFLKNANLQFGYLLQTVNTTTKQYLQTAIFYNIDLRKN